MVTFGPYRLDLLRGELWRGDRAVALQPRPMAVLCHLAEHAGEVVTKEDLLAAVWDGVTVSRTTLKVCVRNVRQALGEDADAPGFIQTVGREGYRFTGTGPGRPGRSALAPVGRDAEHAWLLHCLAQARRGERRTVFVTGEPGIGKTTVVRRFLADVAAADAAVVGRGQCLEQVGEGEAYLPVLDALAHVCRQPAGASFVDVLRRHAPGWLLQLPGLVSDEVLDAIRRRATAASSERLLHEMGAALETFGAQRPLVLVLEDLHWADVSTLELIAYLARRPAPARLLVIGTFRPTDVIVQEHPLRRIGRELRGSGAAEERMLELLTVTEVAALVERLLAPSPAPGELAASIHALAQGNPLFTVAVIEHLLGTKLLVHDGTRWRLTVPAAAVQHDLPESVRDLIERHFERLSDEQRRLLEVASLVGIDFAATAVAAGLGEAVEDVDERLEELVARDVLDEVGIEEWPDGTLGGRYAFRHALHRAVLRSRVGGARRARIHRRVGEALEAAWGPRAPELAATLAMHFETARDPARAVRHLVVAGDTAVSRDAHREAARYFERAVELNRRSAEPEEQRRRRELQLHFRLVASLSATRGVASPEVGTALARVRALGRGPDADDEMLFLLPVLRAAHQSRGELHAARELAERHVLLATRSGDPLTQLWARYGLGETLLAVGELTATRDLLDRATTEAPPETADPMLPVLRTVHHPGVACRVNLGATRWYLGDPDGAHEDAAAGLAAARSLAHPMSIAYALDVAAMVAVLRREVDRAAALSSELLGLAEEQGLRFWQARASVFHGWSVAMTGDPEQGATELRDAISAQQAIGIEVPAPAQLVLLGEAWRRAGRTSDAVEAVAKALGVALETGARCWEAEAHRLQGELLCCDPGAASGGGRSRPRGRRRPSGDEEAAAAVRCFERSLAVAREQRARGWELRAATSLVRLCSARGEAARARAILADVCVTFERSAASADVAEARALLSGT